MVNANMLGRLLVWFLALMLWTNGCMATPVATAQLVALRIDLPIPLTELEAAMFASSAVLPLPPPSPPLPPNNGTLTNMTGTTPERPVIKKDLIIGPVQPPWMDPRYHGIAPPKNGTLWRCDTNRKSPEAKHVLEAAAHFSTGAQSQRWCKRDPYNPKSHHFTGSYEEIFELGKDKVHVYLHGYMGQDRCKLVGEQLEQLVRGCTWNFPNGDGVRRVGGVIFYMNNPRTYTWISVTKKPLDWHAPT